MIECCHRGSTLIPYRLLPRTNSDPAGGRGARALQSFNEAHLRTAIISARRRAERPAAARMLGIPTRRANRNGSMLSIAPDRVSAVAQACPPGLLPRAFPMSARYARACIRAHDTCCTSISACVEVHSDTRARAAAPCALCIYKTRLCHPRTSALQQRQARAVCSQRNI